MSCVPSLLFSSLKVYFFFWEVRITYIIPFRKAPTALMIGGRIWRARLYCVRGSCTNGINITVKGRGLMYEGHEKEGIKRSEK